MADLEAIGTDSKGWAETLALAIIPMLDIINRKCTKEAMPINSFPIIITRTAFTSAVVLLVVAEAVVPLAVLLTAKFSQTMAHSLRGLIRVIIALRKLLSIRQKPVLKDATLNP